MVFMDMEPAATGLIRVHNRPVASVAGELPLFTGWSFLLKKHGLTKCCSPKDA